MSVCSSAKVSKLAYLSREQVATVLADLACLSFLIPDLKMVRSDQQYVWALY